MVAGARFEVGGLDACAGTDSGVPIGALLGGGGPPSLMISVAFWLGDWLGDWLADWSSGRGSTVCCSRERLGWSAVSGSVSESCSLGRRLPCFGCWLNAQSSQWTT